MENSRIKRRNFVKTISAAGAGLTLQTPSFSTPPKRKKKTVRMGVIGIGNRGSGLLKTLLNIENVEIVALCDINKSHLDNAINICIDSGRKKPEGYY